MEGEEEHKSQPGRDLSHKLIKKLRVRDIPVNLPKKKPMQVR